MKNWLVKKMAEYLEKKAELYEGTPKHGQPWFKSKTIWSGLVVLLRSFYEGATILLEQAQVVNLPPIPPILDAFLLGLLGAGSVKGRIDANKPIKLS